MNDRPSESSILQDLVEQMHRLAQLEWDIGLCGEQWTICVPGDGELPDALPAPGGLLARIVRAPWSTLTDFRARPTAKLGPGAPISIGRNGTPRTRARVTMFADVGGSRYLITCAHAFHDGLDQVFRSGSKQPIGVLVRNMLVDDPMRDVAVVRLFDPDLGGPPAPPTASPAANDPCRVLIGQALDLRIEAVDLQNPNFYPGGYLVTQRSAIDVFDSGAPLCAPGLDAIFGLLTGVDHGFAYYTPLSGVF